MASLQRERKAQVPRGVLPPEVSFWSSIRTRTLSNPVSQPGLLLARQWGWGRVGKMS